MKEHLFAHIITTLLVSTATATAGTTPLQLEFIGEETFPSGYQFQGIEVGGLSGIDYDKESQRFVAISDDRAKIGPARFYELDVNLDDGYLDKGDIEFTTMTEILDEDGSRFGPGSIDPESIRIAPFPGLLYWTSEGDARNGIKPFVRVMTRDGHFLDEFDIPEKYTPTATTGIRNNLAFESLTFSSSTSLVFTATENALLPDGPAASTDSGSPVRVLALYRHFGTPAHEFIYQTDPVVDTPIPADGFSTNGLVELLTVAPYSMIAVERSFSVGVGNRIKIYQTDWNEATDVIDLASVKDTQITPMTKKLLLDLNDLGITLDNIEGISFGPRLSTGERTLILVSDNNFNATGQFTQFLAFKIIE